MRFDPFCWSEVSLSEAVSSPRGVLRVKCSAPAALYVRCYGVEVLAGYGTAFDLELAEPFSWWLDAPPETRAFIWRPIPTAAEAEGEVFTNIDRMPQETGHLAEVRRAARQLEFQRRQMMSDIRREAAELRASLARVSPQAPAVVEDEPQGEPAESAPDSAPAE